MSTSLFSWVGAQSYTAPVSNEAHFSFVGAVPVGGRVSASHIAAFDVLPTLASASHVATFDVRTQASASHVATFDATTSAAVSHLADWSTRRGVSARSLSAWSLARPVAARHVASFGSMAQASARHVAAFGSMAQSRARHVAVFGSMSQSAGRHVASFGSMSKAAARHVAVFGAMARSKGRHVASFVSMSQSAGRHVASFVSMAQSNGRHVTSFGSMAQSKGRHVTSFGSMSLSKGRHVASFGSMAQSNGRHVTSFGSMAPVSSRHVASFGAMSQSAGRHVAAFGSMSRSKARHVAAFGSMAQSKGRHVAVFGAMAQASARHVSTSSLTADVAARHVAVYAMHARVVASVAHRAAWSLPDARIVTVTGETYLLHQGARIELGEDVQISADEGSAVWLAAFSVLSEADYGRIAIGDELTLVLWDVPVALLCDARRMSREDGAPNYSISAISPAAVLGSPWAVPVSLGASGTASTTVETLVGPVDWRIVNWPLPSSVTALSAPPLEIARQIVAAAGGLLESDLDGSLVARHRYPVTVPDYASQAPDAELIDRDLLAHSDSADVAALENRFVITSGGTAGSDAIQVEAEQDPDDPHAYTVRAYPWPWRAVALVHTGDAATQIGSRAQVTIEHRQLVEVLAGTASISHPAQSIAAADYQYADLGAVRTEGTSVTTAQQGYSQIDIR